MIQTRKFNIGLACGSAIGCADYGLHFPHLTGRQRYDPQGLSIFPGIPRAPGVRFLNVPIINGPGKLSPFTLKIEVSIVLHLT